MEQVLIKLLSFIDEFNPEMHYNKSEKQRIVMFVPKINAEEFMGVIDHIDDCGYELAWKGSYFALELNDFIDSYCEIEIDDFIKLVESHLEKE